MDMAIQCVQASLSVSQRVSFSGGVSTFTSYFLRLSNTWGGRHVVWMPHVCYYDWRSYFGQNSPGLREAVMPLFGT